MKMKLNNTQKLIILLDNTASNKKMKLKLNTRWKLILLAYLLKNWNYSEIVYKNQFESKEMRTLILIKLCLEKLAVIWSVVISTKKFGWNNTRTKKIISAIIKGGKVKSELE